MAHVCACACMAMRWCRTDKTQILKDVLTHVCGLPTRPLASNPAAADAADGDGDTEAAAAPSNAATAAGAAPTNGDGDAEAAPTSSSAAIAAGPDPTNADGDVEAAATSSSAATAAGADPTNADGDVEAAATSSSAATAAGPDPTNGDGDVEAAATSSNAATAAGPDPTNADGDGDAVPADHDAMITPDNMDTQISIDMGEASFAEEAAQLLANSADADTTDVVELSSELDGEPADHDQDAMPATVEGSGECLPLPAEDAQAAGQSAEAASLDGSAQALQSASDLTGTPGQLQATFVEPDGSQPCWTDCVSKAWFLTYR